MKNALAIAFVSLGLTLLGVGCKSFTKCSEAVLEKECKVENFEAGTWKCKWTGTECKEVGQQGPYSY